MGLSVPPENYAEHNQRPQEINKDQIGRKETWLREHISIGAVQFQWMRIFCRCRRYEKIPAIRISPYPDPV
ncbi:MAG: hypothetical protein BWK74_00915 [Desulfobacteraceae bacterium A6]|nr:MAG: hypothetical protein BWK74_00915 [Desulfobacteraceae bacterium A6]